MYGKLHPTQEKLIKAMVDHESESLSLRELGRLIDIESPNTIAHHLKQLIAKGYLIPEEDGGFQVVRQPVMDLVYLPLRGNAACGREEFFADDNVEERIPLPSRTFHIGPDYFLVRARGDSMEPKIHDKDLLLVAPKSDAETGQVVLAALDDGIFAKKFVRDDDRIMLLSFNQNYYPVTVSSSQRFRILGLVRGVLRNAIR